MTAKDMFSHRVSILTGHYGTGKTEVSVNLALALAAEGEQVMLADLDIVNPYFRSRERRPLLEKAGVRVISSSQACSDADVPALPAELLAILENREIRGILDIGGDNAVHSFREKSAFDSSPINAGYMVLNPEIFDYIEGDDTVFEKDTLGKVAEKGELMSYMHRGFWQCMDNKREMDMLEKLWQIGQAPWKKWN